MMYKSLFKTNNNYQADLRRIIPSFSQSITAQNIDPYIAEAERWVMEYIGECLYNRLANEYEEVCKVNQIQGDGARWVREAIEVLQFPIAYYTAAKYINTADIMLGATGARTPSYTDTSTPITTPERIRIYYQMRDLSYDYLEYAIYKHLLPNSKHYPDLCKCDISANWASKIEGVILSSPEDFNNYWSLTNATNLLKAGRFAVYEMLLPQIRQIEESIGNYILCPSLYCRVKAAAARCNCCQATSCELDDLIKHINRLTVAHVLHLTADLYILRATPEGYRLILRDGATPNNKTPGSAFKLDELQIFHAATNDQIRVHTRKLNQYLQANIEKFPEWAASDCAKATKQQECTDPCAPPQNGVQRRVSSNKKMVMG